MRTWLVTEVLSLAFDAIIAGIQFPFWLMAMLATIVFAVAFALTPGMTEDHLRTWIAEADARAHQLTNRVGWLTWGIRSGHWPAAHPQLRPRRPAARAMPPMPAPPPAPVSAEQAAWQAVWSAVQTRLMAHVPARDYATWLQETALVELGHG